MTLSNNFSCTLVLVFLGISCSSSVPKHAAPETEQHHSLDDVFSATDPHAFYVSSYGSFRFSSRATIQTSKDSPETNAASKTDLERDEQGNFHFTRKPMFDGPKIELMYLNRNLYIRTTDEEEFLSTSYQPEFDRWITTSFRELFDLFSKHEFGKDAPTSTNNSLQCWENKSGSFCVDENTGLPLRGELTVRDGKLDPIKIIFTVVPERLTSLSNLPTNPSEKSK